MFSKNINILLNTMQSCPLQIIGNSDDLEQQGEKIYFSLIQSNQLSLFFDANTKFIVNCIDSKHLMSHPLIPKFLAYYLPFALNDKRKLTLGNECDVLITPMLTGCTFLVTKSLDQNINVYHFNAQTIDGNIDQDKINSMIEDLPYYEKENIIFKLTKEDYAHSENDVPVIGVRNLNNHWSFHYQTSKTSSKANWLGRHFSYENTMSRSEKIELLSSNNNI